MKHLLNNKNFIFLKVYHLAYIKNSFYKINFKTYKISL